MPRRALTEVEVAAKRQYDAARYARLREQIRRATGARHVARRVFGDSRSQGAAWRARNPARSRAISTAYKARRRAIEGKGISGPELAAWVATQVKTCFWCDVDCAEKFEVDHFQPLSKGGLHEVFNLVIACPDCNRHKSAADPFVFAIVVGKDLSNLGAVQ